MKLFVSIILLVVSTYSFASSDTEEVCGVVENFNYFSELGGYTLAAGGDPASNYSLVTSLESVNRQTYEADSVESDILAELAESGERVCMKGKTMPVAPSEGALEIESINGEKFDN